MGAGTAADIPTAWAARMAAAIRARGTPEPFPSHWLTLESTLRHPAGQAETPWPDRAPGAAR
ncbi:hypothetical protein K9U40_20615, partial [Xanthobacter autotrophicus]|uniref:hypothetical protein n=1 Tax=Xanthobacter autotrophicus TaxID=280 RepID=UPI0024AA1E88